MFNKKKTEKRNRVYAVLTSDCGVLPKKEREAVKEAVRNGTYYFEDTVWVETMADTGILVRQGTGRLVQTPSGIRLECRYYGEAYTLIRSGRSIKTLHHGRDEQETAWIEIPAVPGCFRCRLSGMHALLQVVYAAEEIHRQAMHKR